MQCASSWGYKSSVSALIKLGADIDWQGGPDNDTALISAAYNGYRGVVGLLVEAGADLNLRDSYNKAAQLNMVFNSRHCELNWRVVSIACFNII